MATIYTVLGKEANQIAENLDLTDPADPDSLIAALASYFEPQKIQFSNAIDQYLNRLRKLAVTCDYGTLTSQLVLDRLVIAISDEGDYSEKRP